jgi:hypothetical protein
MPVTVQWYIGIVRKNQRIKINKKIINKFSYIKAKVKVKHSRYTPWRRLGGEEI